MKKCDDCEYRIRDYTLEKMFKCRLQDKHFDNPSIHGMLCKKYRRKEDETDGRDTKDGNR